ncbi:arylsulfatase [Paenibacillus koleovorans]|uniref:arylsulfatase n=1 Tax=Paenibacillus koleovorans TaxID=121608 RepID=UPI000FD8F1B5|nr:arylsulfatase [Paenibacillus koleovorans]
MSQPNVLLLMTDQHRGDAAGCYGNPVLETPYIDWLASRGTLFTSAYSPSPSCIPARACLLTGMDPWNTGILGTGNGQGPMGVGFEHTLPGELSKAGYHTHGIGNLHFFPQRSLNGFHSTQLDEEGRGDPGFVSDYREWFEDNKTGDYDIVDHGLDWNSWIARPYHAPEFIHPTNWTVNESIRFLKRRDPSKPFFLKTSFTRPHSPYDALPYYFDLYMSKSLPRPYVGDWSAIHDVPADAVKPDAWRGKRSEEEIRRARAGYYGSISQIDHQIGRLMMFMRRTDLLRNTIVIFTSDHGDMLGDHHLWRKTYAYEGSARIPMIICLPESHEGSIRKHVDLPVTLQDIMPTLLDALGLDIPASVDGMSMMNLIRGNRTAWREYVHGEHSTCYSEEQEMQYVTDGKWKYIWFPRLGTEQLFHLSDDPEECRNLIEEPEHQAQKQIWQIRLMEILGSRNRGLVEEGELICQRGKPPIVSPKYNERLEKSGYKWM